MATQLNEGLHFTLGNVRTFYYNERLTISSVQRVQPHVFEKSNVSHNRRQPILSRKNSRNRMHCACLVDSNIRGSLSSSSVLRFMCTSEIYKAAANPNITFSYRIPNLYLITEGHLASHYDTREMAPPAAGSCVFAGLCALENCCSSED